MPIELKKFPTKLQWRIDRRALVQALLFDLWSFLDRHSEFWQGPDDFWHMMNRLVAIGFSLWRAAFLTDASGERKEIQSQTKEFIEKVLTHNAITFADDHKMSELTMLYYNNNARYRLERMVRHNPNLAQLPSFQSDQPPLSGPGGMLV
jgi:hypothetical protein